MKGSTKNITKIGIEYIYKLSIDILDIILEKTKCIA